MKKIAMIGGIIAIITIFHVFFFFMNKQSYVTIKKIQDEKIQHPELIPKKEYIKYTSFGFNNLQADIYWLEVIQYIGGNVFGSHYKKYLFAMLDIITELNPYFESPYIIGQLLLPTYNIRYDDFSEEERMKHIKQGEYIGLKGMKFLCDTNKVDAIIQEDNFQKLSEKSNLKNPCKTVSIPFGQAYIYFYYLHDYKQAATYYKISAQNEDAPIGAEIMMAIMNGKYGDRKSSILIFLLLALSDIEKQKEKNQKCIDFYTIIAQYWNNIFEKKIETLNEKNLFTLNQIREEYFPFDKDTEKKIILENGCINYLNKAVREFNLAFLDEANTRYFEKYNTYALTPEELQKKGMIQYIPKDYQQYDGYGIVYKYNTKTGKFDYTMDSYEKK